VPCCARAAAPASVRAWGADSARHGPSPPGHLRALQRGLPSRPPIELSSPHSSLSHFRPRPAIPRYCWRGWIPTPPSWSAATGTASSWAWQVVRASSRRPSHSTGLKYHPILCWLCMPATRPQVALGFRATSKTTGSACLRHGHRWLAAPDVVHCYCRSRECGACMGGACTGGDAAVRRRIGQQLAMHSAGFATGAAAQAPWVPRRAGRPLE
jgi:hypothetical protein